jgi:large subunit ribosomal protein L15
MITLHSATKVVTKKKQRVGRGNGSNRGKNSGAGNKGQVKRGHIRIGFEGGQKPLIRRTPKLRGFKQHDKKDFVALPLDLVISKLDGHTQISLQILKEKNIISSFVKEFKLLSPRVKGEYSITVPEGENIYLTKGAKASIK